MLFFQENRPQSIKIEKHRQHSIKIRHFYPLRGAYLYDRQQEGYAYSHGRPRCSWQDHNPLQAEARGSGGSA